MCIRAIKESLFCAANITFLPQKTADILNYALIISFKLNWIQDPPFVIADKKWFWQKVIWSEMDVYASICLSHRTVQLRIAYWR